MKLLIVTDQLMFGQSWGDYLCSKYSLFSRALTCTTALATQIADRERPDYILCDLWSYIEAFQLITGLRYLLKRARIVVLLSGDDPRPIVPLLMSKSICRLLTSQSVIDELVRCF